MALRLAVPLLLLALLAWGPPAQAQDRETRALVFLGNQALPPMVYVQGGKAKGIVVDLVKKLSEEMGRPIEIRSANWAQAQKDLAEGRVDALVQINKTESRLLVYDFSEPLLASRFSIFVRHGTGGIVTAKDLQGLRVGVEPKSFPELILKADPLIALVPISTILDGFLQLQAGKMEALVADQWVGQYILAVNRLKGIGIVGEPVAVSQSAIAVRKGDQGLLDSINAGLDRMRKDGSYQGIIDRWRPKSIVYQTEEQLVARTIRVLALVIGLVLLLSLAFILVLLRRLAAERSLKAELSVSEAKYRALFSAESDALFLAERATGTILDCNESALRMYGYSREELLGSPNTIISAEPELTKVSTQAPIGILPLRYHRKKDGTVFPVEIALSAATLNGVDVVIGAARDITERVEASRKITALLREKDLILREAHHRVKNNMASVISLLSFHRRSHMDSPAGAILLEAMAKVQSMGILYDKLYRSENTGAIEVGEYLSGLLERALELFERRGSIALKVEVAAITMDAARLAPLGIVLNELLTNSIKHAFGECPSPRIEVEGRLSGPDLILVYRDNGQGLPEDPPSESPEGFGLQLIAGLVAQLGGTVQAESAGGARYTIRIPA